MADKESLVNDQNSQSPQQQQHNHNQTKQHQAMFSTPNLSGKPITDQLDASQSKQQLAAAANEQGANPLTSGYYQNVKTKSKLILPTALWILIIVGGLCFLSLLSSLNRTLGTLDTLIEIEQSEHNKNNQYKPGHEMKRLHTERQSPPVAEKLQASESANFPHSWFSLPAWTSLEPSSKVNHKKSAEKANESGDDILAKSIEDVLDAIGGQNREDGFVPVGGSITITSSSSNNLGDLPNIDRLGSIFSPGPLVEPNIVEEAFRRPQRRPFAMFKSNNEPVDNQNNNNKEQPLITANIDKLNININAAPSSEQEIRKAPFAPLSDEPIFNPTMLRRKPILRLGENEENMLEKSIDSMMSKLMEPAQPVMLPPKSFMFPLDLDQPIRASQAEQPDDALKLVHFHQHHPHRVPISPLGRLIFTPQHFGDLVDGDSSPMSPFESGIVKPMMFSRPPQAPHFIIALNDNHEPGRPSMEGPLKSLGQHPGAPQPSSPYELMIPNDPPKLDLKPQSEDDLAESVAQSLFKALEATDPNFAQPDQGEFAGPNMMSPPPPPSSAVEPALPLEGSMVFINGEPLISEKKQSLASSEDGPTVPLKPEDRNQVNELFNLFFGPPPNSKLVVAQPHIVEPSEAIKESKPVKDESSSSPLEQTIKVSANLESKPTNQEENKEEVPIDQVAGDIFNQMFTSPQFDGQPNPQKVDQGQAGMKEHSPPPPQPAASTTTTNSVPEPLIETSDVITTNLNETQADVKDNQDKDVFQTFADMILSSQPATASSLSPTGDETTTKSNLEKSVEQEFEPKQLATIPENDSRLVLEQAPQPVNPTELILNIPTQQQPTEPTLSSTTASKVESESDKPTAETSTTKAQAPVSSNSETITTKTSSTTQTPLAQGSLITTPGSTSNKSSDKPMKSLLQKADEFIEKNIFNFRRFLA